MISGPEQSGVTPQGILVSCVARSDEWCCTSSAWALCQTVIRSALVRRSTSKLIRIVSPRQSPVPSCARA